MAQQEGFKMSRADGSTMGNNGEYKSYAALTEEAAKKRVAELDAELDGGWGIRSIGVVTWLKGIDGVTFKNV